MSTAATSTVAAETIDVADHGIVPGRDVTLAVRDLLESVRDRKDVTLSFPKGVYDFHPDNAFESYRAVANHDNGLKRFGFPIFGRDSLTIDGGGSTFLFHGRMVPFTVDGGSEVTLKNFTIDWTQSFHAELHVVGSDAAEKRCVVETDAEAYPYTIAGGEIRFHRYGQDDPVGSNIVFDPKTNSPIYRTNEYRLNEKKAKFTAIGPGRFAIEKGFKQPPPVGSVLVVYGVHPTSRLCPAIHVTNSNDLRIENVTVHEAGGMGLIVERTDNISLDGMVVTSNEERLAATRADATHFIGCKGTVRIENCLFEHMLDDGINVHGAYVKVIEGLGERRLLCEISHFQQWGLTFAQPGDKVALLSRETLLPFHETTIEAVQPLNEHRFAITLADLPDELPDVALSVENLTWYPDLVVRNTTIRENRARSILVTTKGKVLIEDNLFSSQMHGILIEGDNNKWYESGAVDDVTIRRNRFENIGFSVNQCYPLLASPLLTSEQRWGDQRYHRNIHFTDNTISGFNGLIAKAASVSGLTITGNQVVLNDDYPGANEGPSIDLEYCQNVTINSNDADGFDRNLSVISSENSEDVQLDANQGIDAASPSADDNAQAKAKNPNIVLLFVDDLGWNDLGYRNAKFETPNIDRLAGQSLDFQRAYVASPTCSPSRATLLTGQHPARLQMVRHIPTGSKNEDFDTWGRTDVEYNHWEGDPARFPCRNWLPLEHTTYAEALRELGYYNQFVGKWHLGHEPYHPVHQGFDSQFGTTNFGHPKSYNSPFFKNTDVLTDAKSQHLTDVLTDESVRFLSEYERDQPFMLSLWYYGVHRPPIGRPDLVEYFLDKGYAESDAIYAAQVKAVDESVGRIREAISSKGIERETILVFLSDQGSWYENLPLRGNKRVDTLCEGGVRVPMMIHWPGKTDAGAKSDIPVQSTDLFPTIVEIAGGDPESHSDLDGVSLAPLLNGKHSLERSSPLFGYRAYQDLYASVRKGDWNMLAYRSGKVELYDVVKDVSEKHDVASENQSVVRQLTDELIQWEQKMSVQQYSGVQ
ncbi:sulfatase-like hydrolase/transferase [Allorhodopirellula solitaria]|nr:sulfatase-like hydrolase/transferase [Allorhodopirellula solitaria]